MAKNARSIPDDCERTATVALTDCQTGVLVDNHSSTAALDGFSTVFEPPLCRSKNGHTHTQKSGHERPREVIIITLQHIHRSYDGEVTGTFADLPVSHHRERYYSLAQKNSNTSTFWTLGATGSKKMCKCYTSIPTFLLFVLTSLHSLAIIYRNVLINFVSFILNIHALGPVEHQPCS